MIIVGSPDKLGVFFAVAEKLRFCLLIIFIGNKRPNAGHCAHCVNKVFLEYSVKLFVEKLLNIVEQGVNNARFSENINDRCNQLTLSVVIAHEALDEFFKLFAFARNADLQSQQRADERKTFICG